MKKPSNAVIYAALILLFIILTAPRLIQIRSLRIRSQNLETELQKLKKENQMLENELRLLREDPTYLEKVAREKFNKARQGEIVYKVVREGEGSIKK